MKVSRTVTGIAVPALLVLSLATPALAVESDVDVGSYLNCGVGEEGRQAMQDQRKFYNLHLVFAKAGTGEFVSGVALDLQRVGDPGSAAHFDDCGPLFFIRLRPGNYRLIADFEGTKQSVSIKLGAQGANHTVYWH